MNKLIQKLLSQEDNLSLEILLSWCQESEQSLKGRLDWMFSSILRKFSKLRTVKSTPGSGFSCRYNFLFIRSLSNSPSTKDNLSEFNAIILLKGNVSRMLWNFMELDGGRKEQCCLHQTQPLDPLMWESTRYVNEKKSVFHFKYRCKLEAPLTIVIIVVTLIWSGKT